MIDKLYLMALHPTDRTSTVHMVRCKGEDLLGPQKDNNDTDHTGETVYTHLISADYQEFDLSQMVGHYLLTQDICLLINKHVQFEHVSCGDLPKHDEHAHEIWLKHYENWVYPTLVWFSTASVNGGGDLIDAEGVSDAQLKAGNLCFISHDDHKVWSLDHDDMIVSRQGRLWVVEHRYMQPSTFRPYRTKANG